MVEDTTKLGCKVSPCLKMVVIDRIMHLNTALDEHDEVYLHQGSYRQLVEPFLITSHATQY